MTYTADLVVPIELSCTGRSSSDTATVTFAMTSTPLNPANYDGTCTYYFEVVASNADIDTAYDVHLYDATNAAEKATCTVEANQTVIKRYRSSSFTPASGNNTYQLRIDQTGAADDVKVFAARIIVEQVGASKTRVQIPLVNGLYTSVSNSTTLGAADASSSATYTQGSPERFSQWARSDTNWGTVASYDFEATLRTTNASGAAYAILTNKTDAADIAATEVSTASTTYVVLSANFAGNATNFHDSDTYYVCIHNDGTYSTRINNAFLYLNISVVSKGEIYWRVARNVTYNSAAADQVIGRAKLDTSGYSSPVSYHEATCSGSTGSLHLHDQGQGADADYSVTSPTDITNSTLTPASSRGIVRSASALTGITSADRIWARKDESVGSSDVSSQWLVVAWTGAEAGNTQLDAANSDAVAAVATLILTRRIALAFAHCDATATAGTLVLTRRTPVTYTASDAVAYAGTVLLLRRIRGPPEPAAASAAASTLLLTRRIDADASNADAAATADTLLLTRRIEADAANADAVASAGVLSLTRRIEAAPVNADAVAYANTATLTKSGEAKPLTAVNADATAVADTLSLTRRIRGATANADAVASADALTLTRRIAAASSNADAVAYADALSLMRRIAAASTNADAIAYADTLALTRRAALDFANADAVAYTDTLALTRRAVPEFAHADALAYAKAATLVNPGEPQTWFGLRVVRHV